MRKDQGMPFGSKGPEGMDPNQDKANDLGGAKGPGMKHVVSPGAGAPPMGGPPGMGGGMDY